MTEFLLLMLLQATQATASHGVMYHYPQWAPDGKSILASGTNDGDLEIYLLDLQGGRPRKLTNNTNIDDAARWVDQGRRILFESDRRGRLESFLMDADGSNVRPASAGSYMPVNSAGDVTLLEEQRAGGQSVIVAVHRDGKRLDLSSGPHAEEPSFSPDGRFVVYEQRSPDAPNDVLRSNVVVVGVDGRNPRVVTAGTNPSWSPDGRSLVFKLWAAESKELWIATVNPDGTGLTRLAPGVHPAWSPDGRRIAFMSDSTEGTHIWVIDRAGTNKRCVTCGS